MFRSLCPLDIVDEKKTAIVEVADVYECGEHVNCWSDIPAFDLPASDVNIPEIT